RDGLFVAPVELCGTRSGRGIVHARAEVVLAIDMPPAPSARPAIPLPAYSRSLSDVYESSLFHGADLQGIVSVDGCDVSGIVGSVRSAPAPVEWLRRPLRQRWLADPLALDAAFQLLILWSWQVHGAANLPCLLGRYRQYRKVFPDVGVRVLTRVSRHTELHVVADLDFVDADGRLVARLGGYEAIIDPTLHQAFRRNRLVTSA